MTWTLPSFADLYLAFRQAKTAMYYERRGVGLIDLAKFEAHLPDKLGTLREVLDEEPWFDGVDPGEVWLVPKRLRLDGEGDDDIVRIGPAATSESRVLDVDLRLSPNPAFAIVEVLYLREFGPALESLLSSNVVGYRLDLKYGRLDPNRRWCFGFWPKQYREFRTEPLEAAKRHLKDRGSSALVFSADLAGFFGSVDPTFLLMQPTLEAVGAHDGVDLGRYVQATDSLIRAYARFRRLASSRVGVEVRRGIPIGALTSRLVANVSLASLDAHVESAPGVLCYRRYVDDFVAVVAQPDGTPSLEDVLQSLLPIGSHGDNEVVIDETVLGRPNCELRLQMGKLRLHHLSARPGKDFVEAVLADFDRLVSRNQAFLDPTTLLHDGALALMRSGGTEGSPLRVLRNADRARLETFALSTSLRTLERASRLLDPEAARALVRRMLEGVGRVLAEDEDWVANLDTTIRLVKLALSSGDLESLLELNERLDHLFLSEDQLKGSIEHLAYRGERIDPERAMPWIWLRNYLHQRRIEAVCSVLPPGMTSKTLLKAFPGGVMYRTGVLKLKALNIRARLLVQADLRAVDREADPWAFKVDAWPLDWLEDQVEKDESLLQRFGTIRDFLDVCAGLEDQSWRLPPAKLFLLTRPPSYFDVARRMLHTQAAAGSLSEDAFDRLLAVVNAIRGTQYQDPAGCVVDAQTVALPWAEDDDELTHPMVQRDPRLVLGNLVVERTWWQSAATRTSGRPRGQPVLTLERLYGLNRVIARAAYAARAPDSRGVLPPTLLVLPELSIPRPWFRDLAQHIVRLGRFGAVIGLEYSHDTPDPYVLNQAYAVLPGPFGSVASWPWTKRRPSRGEADRLGALAPPLLFRPAPAPKPRLVVDAGWGRFSALICSELIEVRQVADLLGRVELVLCPAWNPDTSSYDHLVQSAGFQLHALIGIANNGALSDCRAWGPRRVRWERDLCRLIERGENEVVKVDLPLQSLKAFHQDPTLVGSDGKADWRPLPPDWPDDSTGTP